MSLRRHAPILIALLLVAGALPAGAGGSRPERLAPEVLTGPSPRAIVMFDGQIDAARIARLSAVGITHAFAYPAIDAIAVQGPQSAYIDIARWTDVVRVEEDKAIEFHNHVAKIDTKVDRVRAGKSRLRSDYTGEGVTVAVVDSGVDTTHPDLFDRFAVNLDMENAPNLDPITGGTYSEEHAERPVGTDEYGHGTHVAGIVGGSGLLGQGADLSGVAPDASLINCKIGLSFAFESSALACFQWLLDNRKDERFPGGVRVVTNSWGLGEPNTGSKPLEDMVKALVKAGITVVFSAGNSGPMREGESAVVPYPNRMDEVITVAATCKSEGSSTSECDPLGVAAFSSQGPEVDIAAPGVDIWAPSANVSAVTLLGLTLGSRQLPGQTPVDQAVNRAKYIGISGTSMSAPHVAGIVALMIEAAPKLKPRRVEQILIRTATDMGPRGFDVGYGHGMVNALKAVRAAEKR